MDNNEKQSQKLNSLADELLATSSGATIGAVGGTVMATSTIAGGILFPVVGSVVGGIVGFAAIKIVEARKKNKI